PDQQPAVIRIGERRRRQVESPIGTAVYHARALDLLRSSPRGALAFVEGPDDAVTGAGHRVVRIDPGGAAHPVGGTWREVTGLAWAPDGDALVISATREGDGPALWRVPARGDAERLWSSPGAFAVHDVAADGTLLVASAAVRRRIFARLPGWPEEREL